MQQAELTSNITDFPVQPTADFCDANPDAEILQNGYRSFGAVSVCVGKVETISTQDDNSIVKATLTEQGDGRVLFVDNSASTSCAMLGGDLARLAARNGWAGIVINGSVRDVEELKEVPIGIFALASCPRKSKKRGLGNRGRPVRIGGAYIRRDDIIAADADGVVFLASWAARTHHV